MSDYGWVMGGVFFTFFLLIIFTNIAIYNAEIECPGIAEEIQSGLEGDAISQIWTYIATFFSPCSGLPVWVYLLIFLPVTLGLVIFLTPFIGS
jgi:hypothetical protein